MPKQDVNKEWDPGGHLPIRDKHFYSMIVSAVDGIDDGDGGGEVVSRKSSLHPCGAQQNL